MRTWLRCGIVLVFLAMCPVGQAVQDSDALLGLSYHDTDWENMYDDGLLGDVMIRGWYKNNLGFAVAVGAGAYRADARTSSFASGAVRNAKASGHVMMLPLGMSGLYRVPLGEDAALSFDAGFRYVMVEPNADLRATLNGAGPINHKLDIDHGWTGVLGLNYERKISEYVSWLVGGGYQFDLDEGKVQWLGVNIGDNELESVFIRVGLVFRDK